MESLTQKIGAFATDWSLACDDITDEDDDDDDDDDDEDDGHDGHDDGDDDDSEDDDDNNEVMNAESVSWCQRNFVLF